MSDRGRLPGRVKPPGEKLTLGRPRLEPKADAADAIRAACESGASRQGVAMALGVSVDVLTRWLDEHPDLKEAFDQGREKERRTLHDALTSAAKGGNITAAIFLLKARHGYREGEADGAGNRVSVTFNIPAAMPLDKFMVIENGSQAEPVPAKPALPARRG